MEMCAEPESETKTTRACELLPMDLCGPMRKVIRWFRYSFLIEDKYSRYGTAHLLKEVSGLCESQTFDVILKENDVKRCEDH